MSTDTTVTLLVGGTEYGGWKSVRIAAGIDQAARSFDLAVTDRWPGQTWPRRVRPGESCQVYIGDDLVLTGYVDATPIRFDGKQVTVGVKGRSKTADLIDCSAIHEPGQISKRKIEDVAAALAEPYGVQVLAQIDTGAAVTHQVEPGETVFESIDRLLKARAVLATDDGRGRLLFTRAGQGGPAGEALQVGVNVLSGSTDLDFKDRFSEYVAKGTAAATAKAGEIQEDDGSAQLVTQARVTDPNITRRRVLVIVGDGQADGVTLDERIRWEATSRAGKSYSTTYVVQGWRKPTAKTLWLPNEMVTVTDPVIGTVGWDMCIGKVTYDLGEAGMLTTLEVAPKQAWELLPKVSKDKALSGGGGKDDAIDKTSEIVKGKT